MCVCVYNQRVVLEYTDDLINHGVCEWIPGLKESG